MIKKDKQKEFKEKLKGIKKDITSSLILVLCIILLFISIPWVVKNFLNFTLSKPFEAQREAISKSNKTLDTASGVVGTYVNNIPFNDFEKLTNLSSKSFKSVDIQIPRIYVTSPIFNISKNGDALQDIWVDSINVSELKKEFESFNVYYDGNLIIEDGKTYSSVEATANDIKAMKEAIVTELGTNKKFDKISFKKWYVPKQGSDPTETKIVKKGFSIESTFEVSDFKPNWPFGPTLRNVRAEFIKENNKLVLKKNTLEVD